MSDLTVCRMCLVEDVFMYDMVNTRLQVFYEKLTNAPLQTDDGRPIKACYICHYQLKKCLEFVEKSIRANGVLTQLLMSEIELTKVSIGVIDRHKYKLTDGLAKTYPKYIEIESNYENTGQNLKEELSESYVLKCLKQETEILKEEIKDTEIIAEETDFNNDSNNHLLQTDSEDDIPLKNIVNKGNVKTKSIKKRYKEAGCIGDYANEMILSKEQQLEELNARAKSLNYLNSPYQCDMCYKGFVDARTYDNHKQKHDERSGAFCCDICRMRYRTSRQLRSHAATAHERQYACRHCGHRSHTANQAREHEKWHRGYTYECQLCGQKFKKSTSYLTHKRKRHPTEHVCDVCGDSFVGRHGLLMHKSKTHQRELRPIDNVKGPASERYCKECDIQFVTINAWKLHILTSIKHTLQNESSAECPICKTSYPPGAARKHLRGHAKELNTVRTPPIRIREPSFISCDQCNARFVNRSKLKAHVKRMHLGVKYNKNIVCEVCGKKCASNAALTYHQRTHTGERPYPCGTCHKRFADNNQLRIHMRTHTGERPYACDACGKRFSQKPALNRHYRVHTGVKPYVCQYCSKTFSQSSSVKLHVRTVHLKLPTNRKNKIQNVTRGADASKETVPMQTL